MAKQAEHKTLDFELEVARANVYRKHVLNAAEQVFAESGYDGATIRDIAARADVAVGSVYRVFEGKTELYLAVHQRHSEELVARSAKVAAADTDVWQKMLDGASVTVSYLCEHTNYLRILLHQATSWSQDSQQNDIQAQQWAAGHQILSQTIATGIKEGPIRDGDPDRFARLVMAIYQAILGDWLLNGQKQSPAEVVAEIQDLLRRLLVA